MIIRHPIEQIYILSVGNIDKLKDIQVKSFKFETQPFKLTDGGGLYLLVNKTGKYLRYDNRYLKRRKTLSLGVYPEISLKKARQQHKFDSNGL